MDKNRIKRLVILPVLIFCAGLSLYGQTKKEELRKEKQEIEETIRYTNKLLSETADDKKSSLKQLSLLEQSVKNREQLITTISSEVAYLNDQIRQNKREISRLNQELEQLKDEYAKMIYHAYKTRSRYHRLMFIFSAEDFDQAYRRLKHFRQYADYRRKQAALINEKKEKLSERNATLKEDTERKTDLLANKEQERRKLKAEKEGHSQTVHNLQEKEQQLKRELAQKRAQAEELENEIERIIAAEMAEAETATPDESPSPEFKLTPEQVELSDDFTSNKGKLPWPTKRGIVSSKFGRNAHENLQGIVELNNGITIQTSKNAEVMAIFSGKVTKVISIGGKKAVLLQHGDYFTLYDHLADVTVNPGQSISTGDVIGIVKTDRDSNRSEINFQIWQARKKGQPEKLNPALWLLPR
ncbi:MAG: peptidoglycan DD-metalloendopeptidase family protein [Bacteroidales bacterium]